MFCTNCGSEIPEGTKFCPDCGAPTTVNVAPAETVQQYIAPPANNEKESGIDRYGKYIGIALFILAILDFMSDPAIITILLSGFIIVGAIFCFGRKYKLKGFTVVALILAAYCMFAGVMQAKYYGLLSTDKTIAEARQQERIKYSSEPKADPKPAVNTNTSPSTTKKVTETKPQTENTTNTDTESASASTGVDPDLKAFLDSYEDFVDEYVDFMKRYNADPNNMVAMLGEYTDMMTRYADFAEKIDKYNSKTMSTEDAKYYLDVTTRCSKKMLEVY